MLDEIFMNYKCKYFDGCLWKEYRDEDGKLHREDGPSIIYHRYGGSVEWEYFYLNGVLHREFGPARILYNPDGSTQFEEFYFDGKYLGISKEGFWALWDNLTEDKRKSPEILKCLARFS
jgi:antitoxin component YwqK of YwqJK toxin-antitoxin module